MHAEQTTVVVAACALLYPTAGPVRVLMIKSLMWITSPAEVIKTFAFRGFLNIVENLKTAFSF